MTILFFAQAAQRMGRRELELALPGPVPLSEILLRRELSALSGALHGTRFAVNQELADLDCPVGDSDIVAVLPPVSGG